VALIAFMIELEFRDVDFCGGRKTGEKPLKQGRESTTIQLTYDAESRNNNNEEQI
jgi:hypothetical protein